MDAKSLAEAMNNLAKAIKELADKIPPGFGLGGGLSIYHHHDYAHQPPFNPYTTT